MVPPLRGQTVGLSAPAHRWVDCSFVKTITNALWNAAFVHNANSAFALEEAFLGLGDPASSASCSVYSQITKDIVVLRIPFLQKSLEGFCCFLSSW